MILEVYIPRLIVNETLIFIYILDQTKSLPKSKGKIFIIVVVDGLTKYAQFCLLSHPFKASTFATTFLETTQKLHGNPKIIVSDRDPIFTRNF